MSCCQVSFISGCHESFIVDSHWVSSFISGCLVHFFGCHVFYFWLSCLLFLVVISFISDYYTFYFRLSPLLFLVLPLFLVVTSFTSGCHAFYNTSGYRAYYFWLSPLLFLVIMPFIFGCHVTLISDFHVLYFWFYFLLPHVFLFAKYLLLLVATCL